MFLDEGSLGVEEMDHEEKERDELSEILREQVQYVELCFLKLHHK